MVILFPRVYPFSVKKLHFFKTFPMFNCTVIFLTSSAVRFQVEKGKLR